ncbi:hypothetical protein FRB94_009282 [Tulasnella sp. JGI-2019a]|nr:hypothetical protein FRB94_009282 [Tulasnella sp. JGI-2019a]
MTVHFFRSLSPLSALLTHTRFLVTLRSRSRASEYHSLIVFRLSTTPLENDPHDHSSGPSQIFAMESTCPHLGADLSHADIEDTDVGLVAVCPWHRYDFDLRTGHSETGLKACTYRVETRMDDASRQEMVWIESPEGAGGWEVVELRPVSEEFADPPLAVPPVVADGQKAISDEPLPVAEQAPEPKSLLEYAVLILNTADAELKVERTRRAVSAFRTGKLKSIGRSQTLLNPPPDVPPRAQTMQIVQPGKVAKRGKAGSLKSRIAILHALANIEQWAIDLAWDIIARFGNERINGEPLPPQFFSDWAKVAEDESKHFSLLRRRLEEMGSFYGAHTVHAGLWESAQQTSTSLSARLCIIHLVHEARGLDVNPTTMAKFKAARDLESVKVLEIIHHDEVTHVTAGHRWFTYLCSKLNVDPVTTFRTEVRDHFSGALKGPFNEEDRRKAGMTPDFYEDLQGELGGGSRPTGDVGTKGIVEIGYP